MNRRSKDLNRMLVWKALVFLMSICVGYSSCGAQETPQHQSTVPVQKSTENVGHEISKGIKTPVGLMSYLYVTNRLDNTITAYRIATDGTLEVVEGGTVATGEEPAGILVGHSNDYLYVANFGDNTISVYRIGGNGSAWPLPGSTIHAGTNPTCISMTPSGDRLYVTNSGFLSTSGGDTVSGYTVIANGKLKPTAGSPFKTGVNPDGLAVSKAGNYLYVSSVRNRTISGYRIEPGGALSELNGSPFPAGSGADKIAITPDGFHLYVANTTGGNISGYSVDLSGALHLVDGSPFDAEGETVEGLAVSPSGKLLAATIVGDMTGVLVFRVETDGSLVPLVSGYVAIVGGDLRGITFSPDGRFVYVANFGSTGPNGILGFKVRTDGSLSPLNQNGFAAGAGPWAMAVAIH